MLKSSMMVGARVALALVPVALFGCADIVGLRASDDGGGATRLADGTCSGALITANVETVDFGEARAGGPKDANASVQLTNEGSVTVTLETRLLGPPVFGVAPALTLGPRETKTLDLTFRPDALGPQGARVELVANTATCAPPPVLTLAGSGSDSPVLVQPGLVDFGEVDCGTVAPARPVTLTSNADDEIAFTTDLSSPHFGVDVLSGRVAPASSIAVIVSPKAAPEPQLVHGVLAVHTGSRREVRLLLESRGAVIHFVPPRIDFTKKEKRKFVARNDGNRAATVTLTLDHDDVKLRGTTKRDLAPGGTAEFEVELDDDEDDVNVSPNVTVTGTALCRLDPIRFVWPGK